MAKFVENVTTIAADIGKVFALSSAGASVILGDARRCDTVVGFVGSKIKAVISSPPYPAEHDYTRHSRLELAFLEEGIKLETLRRIKKRMVRCHTKGIYKHDKDGESVADRESITTISPIA